MEAAPYVISFAVVVLAVWWLFFTTQGSEFRRRSEVEYLKAQSSKVDKGRAKRGLYLNADVGTVTVCTYVDDEMDELQRDVSQAARKGWQADQVTGTSGHMNVGKTVAKAVVLTPAVLILSGASRTKGKVVMRFTRVSTGST